MMIVMMTVGSRSNEYLLIVQMPNNKCKTAINTNHFYNKTYSNKKSDDGDGDGDASKYINLKASV